MVVGASQLINIKPRVFILSYFRRERTGKVDAGELDVLVRHLLEPVPRPFREGGENGARRHHQGAAQGKRRQPHTHGRRHAGIRRRRRQLKLVTP